MSPVNPLLIFFGILSPNESFASIAAVGIENWVSGQSAIIAERNAQLKSSKMPETAKMPSEILEPRFSEQKRAFRPEFDELLPTLDKFRTPEWAGILREMDYLGSTVLFLQIA